jgi:hypothetical protein
MNKTEKALTLLLGMVTAAATNSAIAADYNAAPSSFATVYKHIDARPIWAKGDPLELSQPRNFRRWVFIGSPLTPNALNAGKASFPEYHNVYVQPKAFEHYREHREWPEGTMMVKELQLTSGEPSQKDGSRLEVSGRGYFPGVTNGMDVAVKDSTRFAESKNWGYFNFGHHKQPYEPRAKAAPINACAFCHIANANEDMVFMDLYRPIVEPLMLPE